MGKMYLCLLTIDIQVGIWCIVYLYIFGYITIRKSFKGFDYD